MGKKKRQNDPQQNDNGSSTDSFDGNNKQSSNQNSPKNTTGCQHIKKALDLPKLRKLLKSCNLATECKECSKPSVEDNSEFEYNKTLWMCLKCGSQLCGRSQNQHALDHFNIPHSDSHALTLNTTTFEVWCYSCNEEVKSKGKNLQECVEFVRKISQKPIPLDINAKEKIMATLDTMAPLLSDFHTSNGPPPLITTTAATPPIPGMARRVQQQPEKPILPLLAMQCAADKLPSVRGLTNLGNTCFFNAVLQCLAQTPFLMEILQKSKEAGEEFTLPGGNFDLPDKQRIDLPPIEGKLASWGGLTSALAEALKELQSGGGVFTPSELFRKLTSTCQQFRGGDQHDSHELLRHLLESVRSEDLKRYQLVILEKLNYQKNKEHIEEMRQKCKIYGQQAGDRILAPEPVFRGFLVSTLQCQDCMNSSVRHESFLDISLPVNTEKPSPPRRKTSPDSSILGASSSGLTNQLKKEKEKERKAKNAQKNQNKRAAPPLSMSSGAGDIGDNSGLANSASTSLVSRSGSSSSDSDADVEDNLIDDAPKFGPLNFDSNGNNLPSPNSGPSEKRGDSPENPNKDSNDDENDSGIATSPGVVGGAIEQIAQDVNRKNQNVVIALGISEQGANMLRQKSGEGNAPNGIDSTDLQIGLEKLTLDEENQKKEILDAKKQAKAKQRQRLQSYSDWNTTMSPRYQCEDNECSVQSCLNNFTAAELMTGNNKVGCDKCTEKINDKHKKTVYTNSSKQFLISSPPAVLILHLKRFQVGARGMFRKLTCPVSFSMILDLAPFCGSKVKNLPNIDRKQKKLLYALYGIVEHSGSMFGGHYTAFVKVRSKLDPNDKRWSFMPQGSKAELDQTDEQKAKLDELLAKEKAREIRIKANDSDDCSSNDSNLNTSTSSTESDELEGAVGGSPTAEPEIHAPPGKWYYVSDSLVREVSEDTVLKAQAYLLFYERIY